MRCSSEPSVYPLRESTIFPLPSTTSTCGMVCTPKARRKSLLGSSSTSYSQPLPSTKGFTLLIFCAWSIDTMITFTPVSSCQSGYTSWMALSSRLQGLHQVAKKLMINGLPSLFSLAVLIVFPSNVLSCTEGIWALAAMLAIRKMAKNRILFAFILVFIFSANVLLFFDKRGLDSYYSMNYSYICTLYKFRNIVDCI